MNARLARAGQMVAALGVEGEQQVAKGRHREAQRLGEEPKRLRGLLRGELDAILAEKREVLPQSHQVLAESVGFVFEIHVPRLPAT